MHAALCRRPAPATGATGPLLRPQVLCLRADDPLAQLARPATPPHPAPPPPTPRRRRKHPLNLQALHRLRPSRPGPGAAVTGFAGLQLWRERVRNARA